MSDALDAGGNPTGPNGRDVHRVACWLTFQTEPDTAVALQVAVAGSAGVVLDEVLDLTLDDAPLTPTVELVNPGGGRVHVVESGAGGTLRLTYEATVSPSRGRAGVGAGGLGPTYYQADAIAALNQSAYCRSDQLAGFAASEFGSIRDEPDAAQQVATWVFERLAYEPGSSGPLDSAVDTLLTNTGVCRDFAHLTITLLRALGIPARLVAVYAPGLFPMDFHAVVEALGPTGWHVLDATRLAPRSALLRITTGRDAADTAFVTTLRGSAELLASSVFAVTDGELPTDDHETLAYLA